MRLLEYQITTENDSELPLYSEMTTGMGFTKDCDIVYLKTNKGDLAVSLENPFHWVTKTATSYENDEDFLLNLRGFMKQNTNTIRSGNFTGLCTLLDEMIGENQVLRISLPEGVSIKEVYGSYIELNIEIDTAKRDLWKAQLDLWLSGNKSDNLIYSGYLRVENNDKLSLTKSKG